MQPSNGPSTAITRPSDAAYGQAGTAIERRGFGATEMESVRETQGIAAAEHAKAAIQARFIMAERRPRDIEDVRVRLLKHCDRPLFASVAEYAKPVAGQKIRGPSIRFVETALAEYRNVNPEVASVYDDDEKRIIRVTMTDLERNITYTEDVTVEKFVERKTTEGEVIGERRKKNGDIVYKVRATEDDFNNKLGAAISKRIRNLGLRILPADIVDEAMDRCADTRQKKDAEDPNAATHKVADGFAQIGVMPAMLKEYLGHEIGTSSPAEIADLRAIYTAIRDGETTWQTTIDAVRGEAPVIDKTADALKAKLAASTARDKAPDPATAARKSAARRKALEKCEWSAEGDGLVAIYDEHLKAIVEPTGPGAFGWWLMKDGTEAGCGEATDAAQAKAAAIDAASKL